MGLFRKNRGAISIFLVIILVPTMTLAGLFLDVSRVELSKEVVLTSGDLALNTVLSGYDKDLKDYFGLLASCQNTDQVLALARKYFADSMISADVYTSESLTYIDNIITAFTGDDDIRDMLQLSVEGNVDITAAENGAMNNPALLKKGIIEFMKYRAPVNAAAQLFAKITDSGVVEQMEDASKEAKMTEAKKDFYEAEDELIQQAKAAYEAIQKYENYTTSTGRKITEEQFLDDLARFLASPDSTLSWDNPSNNFEDVFRSAHEKMVMNLYNTHHTDGTFSRTLLDDKLGILNPGTIDTYSDDRRAGASTIESLLKDYNQKLKNYSSARSLLNSDWGKVGERTVADYPIQYWVTLTDSCDSSYSAYSSRAAALWRAAAKLENAVTYSAEDAMSTLMDKSAVQNSDISFEPADEEGKLSLQSVYDSLMGKYNESYRHEITGGGINAFKNISGEIDSLNTYENNQKLNLGTVQEIYNIRNKIYHYQEDFDKAFQLVKDAGEKTYKLKSLLEKYKKAFQTWKTAANDPELDSSEMAQENRREIQELEETGIELFSEASVTELVQRLTNIQTLCKTFRDDLNAIKYKNKPVKNIYNFAQFHAASNLNVGNIVRTESVLRQYASDTFSFVIGKQIQRVEIYDNRTSIDLDDGDAYVITDSFHTNIQKTYLELYQWMRMKFDAPKNGEPVHKSDTGFEVSDEGSAKDAKKELSKRSEDTSNVETTENITGHNFGEWTGAKLPSKGKGAPQSLTLTGKISEAADFAASIFSDFSETFMNSLVNMRDDLFMIDYVFSMFTYDTFENEGCYGVLNDSELSADNALEKYQEVIDQWKASNENKTLTLTPRNTFNNWAYGGEVEYILYGNTSNELNKSTAYTQIFMIRYALDLPAVFSLYWEDSLLNTVAAALEIFAFIPSPLTKTLACLAITAAEAGVDVSYLKKGLPVVLRKKERRSCMQL